MPTIRIDYDDRAVSEEDARTLSEAVQKIVYEVTTIEDTFVYANSPHIKIKVAPIEVYVQLSASKIGDVEELFGKIKDRISSWKKESAFKHPINLTLVPMQWKFEVDI